MAKEKVAKALKKAKHHAVKEHITIRLDPSILDYFKKLAKETEVPYQTLINSFLADCAAKKARPILTWSIEEEKQKDK
ncbi:MAG: BrnA antitoxin family protein [Burkholderiales bacterium]|nr:BrnA antitoxin family protein [Burkholderiales bacterium]